MAGSGRDYEVLKAHRALIGTIRNVHCPKPNGLIAIERHK
jgi:hypothetical protein